MSETSCKVEQLQIEMRETGSNEWGIKFRTAEIKLQELGPKKQQMDNYAPFLCHVLLQSQSSASGSCDGSSRCWCSGTCLIAAHLSLQTWRSRRSLAPIIFHDGRDLVSLLRLTSSLSSLSVHGWNQDGLPAGSMDRLVVEVPEGGAGTGVGLVVVVMEIVVADVLVVRYLLWPQSEDIITSGT